MDYTTLVADKNTDGSIKQWINWDKGPSTTIMEAAQGFIYRRLRVREMLSLATGTIALDASTLALPTRYLATYVLGLYGSTKREVVYLDPQHFEQRIAFDTDGSLFPGTPTFCTADATTMQFNHKADVAYTYRHWFYQGPAVLGPSNLTNFLTDRHPDMLLAAALYFAYLAIKDSGMADEQLQIAASAIERSNAEWDMEKEAVRTEMYWRQEP